MSRVHDGRGLRVARLRLRARRSATGRRAERAQSARGRDSPRWIRDDRRRPPSAGRRPVEPGDVL